LEHCIKEKRALTTTWNVFKYIHHYEVYQMKKCIIKILLKDQKLLLSSEVYIKPFKKEKK